MFKGLLEDRILIRERYNTYSDAVFKNDVESWLANYTDNGVWEIANEKHQGKGALREKWELLWAGIDSMAFFTEIGSIEVEDNRAAARCYCHEIVSLKSGKIMKVVGLYEDELVKLQDNWLFQNRRYRALMHEAG